MYISGRCRVLLPGNQLTPIHRSVQSYYIHCPPGAHCPVHWMVRLWHLRAKRAEIQLTWVQTQNILCLEKCSMQYEGRSTVMRQKYGCVFFGRKTVVLFTAICIFYNNRLIYMASWKSSPHKISQFRSKSVGFTEKYARLILTSFCQCSSMRIFVRCVFLRFALNRPLSSLIWQEFCVCVLKDIWKTHTNALRKDGQTDKSTTIPSSSGWIKLTWGSQ